MASYAVARGAGRGVRRWNRGSGSRSRGRRDGSADRGVVLPMSSLLAFAVGSLWRRRGRAFALGVGLSLTVTLVAAVLFLTEALRAEAQRGRGALPDVVVQRLVAGRPPAVKISDAKSLEDIDSVKSVRRR